MNWAFWVILIVVSILFTYLMKYLFKAKTYFIISMLRSEKSANILDKFRQNKFWLWMSKFGIFLGFGFLGILYWYWEDLRYKKKKTAYLSIVFYSIIILIIGLIVANLGLVTNTLVKYIVNTIVFFFFGFAGFGLSLIAQSAYLILKAYFLGRETCPGVAPVIPGITVPGTDFKIPFFEGWIALIIIMVVHELAHGILARKVAIKVKSLGLLLLGFFPIGAFTEPDEQDLKNALSKEQLLVFSSGPTSNLFLAVIILAVMSLIFAPLFSGYISNINTLAKDGIYITDLQEFTQICGFGVESKNYTKLNNLFLQLDLNKKQFFENYNLKILEINNLQVKDSNDLYNITGTDNNSFVFSLLVESKTSKTSFEYSTILEKNSDKSFGIKLQEKAKEDFDYPFGYSVLQFIYTTFKFIVLFSFAVALFNFLPIIMLDGGQMFPIIINEFIPPETHYKKRKLIINSIFISVIIFFLILIAINVLPFFF